MKAEGQNRMSDLILIPTELELARLLQQCPECNRWAAETHPVSRRTHVLGAPTSSEHAGPVAPRLAICGFGLVAAAARTMQLLQWYRPHRVWLVGIAGALSPDLAVGAATEFGSVSIDGIGVGWHDQFRSAASIGWPHWPGDDTTAKIGDQLSLGETAGQPTDAPPHGLLSVAAASQDAAHARWRQQTYPDAVAEDMEGFAVATACCLAGIPCRIIRGISNQAGQRDPRQWKIDAALAAAGERLVPAIG